MKKQIVAMSFMVGASLYGGEQLNPIAQQMRGYSQQADNIINTIKPLAKVAGKEASFATFEEQLKKITLIMSDAAGLVNNIEEIIKMQSTITNEGNLLGARLKCFGNPGGNCAGTLRCGAQNQCIAAVFKNAKTLVSPIVAQLIVSKTKTSQGVEAYTGALVQLGSLITKLPVPAQYKDSVGVFGNKIVAQANEFGTKLNDTLDLLGALAAIIDPAGLIADMEATKPLTQADKDKITSVAIELPAAAKVDPATLDLGDL